MHGNRTIIRTEIKNLVQALLKMKYDHNVHIANEKFAKMVNQYIPIKV